MNSRLIAFLVLSLLSGSVAAVSAQDSTPEKKFAASLTEYTASEPVIVNEVPEDEEDLEGVRSVRINRFKSKAPVSTDPDTYATVVLIVLEYEDSASASAALSKVPAGAEEEMRKSPELDFASGSKLYRLIGACVLSDANWTAVESKLTDAVFGDGMKPERYVRIACGGNVTVIGKR